MLPLTLILALADDGTLGDKGAIPWHIPEDMARFRALTIGRAVIMGRKTWESLPAAVRPLPKRRNIVVSRTLPAFRGAPGAEVWRTLDDAIAAARATDEEPIIMGGAELYREAMPLATRIHLTEVHASPAGDTRLDFDPAGWVTVRRSCRRYAPDGPEYSFVDMVRAVGWTGQAGRRAAAGEGVGR